MRIGAAAAVALAGLSAVVGYGCGSGRPTGMSCKRVASAAELCDSSPCDLTWAAAETDHTHCGACAPNVWSVTEYGPYHVLSYNDLDISGSFFYDASSGDLVATTGTANGSFTWCSVAGGASFSPPGQPLPFVPGDLPGWCSPDAGAPGTRVFPCCKGSIDNCVRVGECPTWSDVQSGADWSWCQGGLSQHPEIAECGGQHLLRYYYSDGTLNGIIYYDGTTNAPVAVITADGCRDGPTTEGLTLPDCSPAFTPACPGGVDGGTDGVEPGTGGVAIDAAVIDTAVDGG